MQREILNPIWDDKEKTRIRCHFRYTLNNGDTRVVRASISNEKQSDGTDNPDWTEVLQTFGIEEIDRLTNKREEDIEQQNRIMKEDRERQRRREYQEEIFDTKLEIFEIEEIFESEDIALKGAIRRGKTYAEIYYHLAKMAAKQALKEMQEEEK